MSTETSKSSKSSNAIPSVGIDIRSHCSAIRELFIAYDKTEMAIGEHYQAISSADFTGGKYSSFSKWMKSEEQKSLTGVSDSTAWRILRAYRKAANALDGKKKVLAAMRSQSPRLTAEAVQALGALPQVKELIAGVDEENGDAVKNVAANILAFPVKGKVTQEQRPRRVSLDKVVDKAFDGIIKRFKSKMLGEDVDESVSSKYREAFETNIVKMRRALGLTTATATRKTGTDGD